MIEATQYYDPGNTDFEDVLNLTVPPVPTPHILATLMTNSVPFYPERGQAESHLPFQHILRFTKLFISTDRLAARAPMARSLVDRSYRNRNSVQYPVLIGAPGVGKSSTASSLLGTLKAVQAENLDAASRRLVNP